MTRDEAREMADTLITDWLATPHWRASNYSTLSARITTAILEGRRTRDREIATMAEDSGIEALRQFAAMLRAEAPTA
jgi:hypothetical protein